MSTEPVRRILAIDGGGIRGVFPAAFLSALEADLPSPIGTYFDLIVGTSTGGIIALGLGLGLRASDLLRFYTERGPAIFEGNRLTRALRQLGVAKYRAEPLRAALTEVFGTRTLAESRTRLVVPSCSLITGAVHLWKTAHHVRLQQDYKCSMVDVALSTAAAPTFFPTHRTSAGIPLVDGGVWANNPVGVATVEAIGVLGWNPATLRVLSLGCTTAPLAVRLAQRFALGRIYWAMKITDVFMAAQSSAAIGMTMHLLTDRRNLVRIAPTIDKSSTKLDAIVDIPTLQGLGAEYARHYRPDLGHFFQTPAPPFVPIYQPGPDPDPVNTCVSTSTIRQE